MRETVKRGGRSAPVVPPLKIWLPHPGANRAIEQAYRNVAGAVQTRARHARILEALAQKARQYVVLTLHRPSNVDDAGVLAGPLEAADHVHSTVCRRCSISSASAPGRNG